LASMQIYAAGTVRSNRVGLPLALKNRRAFRNAAQGTLECCTKWQGGMCFMEKYKASVTFVHLRNFHWISLHAGAHSA
jgi:hypothetical protein